MEVLAMCFEIHTKHIKVVCEQSVEFLNIEPGGTQCNYCPLDGLNFKTS